MNRSHTGAVIAVVSILFVSLTRAQDQASTTSPTNDAIVHHMEELEEQVKELRAEMAAMKSSDENTPQGGAPTPPRQRACAKQSCPQPGRGRSFYGACRSVVRWTTGAN